MKDYHINVFYSKEDEGYIADIPDLKHCSAFGETAEEALREVIKAKEAWLESASTNGKPIPVPLLLCNELDKISSTSPYSVSPCLCGDCTTRQTVTK